MSDVVCEREFKIERDGALVPVIVRWRLPEEAPGGEWRCAYEIGVDGVLHRSASVPGIDSVQALQLAMMTVGSELYSFNPPVFWHDPDDDLGLPVHDVVADLPAERAQRRSSRDG